MCSWIARPSFIPVKAIILHSVDLTDKAVYDLNFLMTSMGFVLPRLVDQDLFYQCVQQLCSQLGGLAAFLD